MNESEPPIDLVLLQTFIQVARLGSVTDAAKLLGRSQPAISSRLRSLEAELGAPLFEKIGRKLVLNDTGRQLQQRCSEIITLSRGLRDIVDTGGQALRGRVRFGVVPTAAAHLLASFTTDLLNTQPEVEVVFTLDLVQPLLERLRTGLVDLVLVVLNRAPAGFECTPLGKTRLAAIIPPSSAGSRRTLSVASLRKMRYLAWSGPADPTADLISAYVAKNELTNQHTPLIPHVETLREMVALGAGYTILPHYTAHRAEGLGHVATRLASGLDHELTLFLVGRSNQIHSPTLLHVRNCLRGLVESDGLRGALGRIPAVSA